MLSFNAIDGTSRLDVALRTIGRDRAAVTGPDERNGPTKPRR
jgi:hypothetical protein